MNSLENIAQKWHQLCEKMKPVTGKVIEICKKIGSVISAAWKYLIKLRKVILAVPVGVGAIYLAVKNLSELPQTVGIDLQSNGTFSVLIAREVAVLGPIAITALCLLLMFASKRTLTPWLVSLFSLAIPLLIFVTNVFPA